MALTMLWLGAAVVLFAIKGGRGQSTVSSRNVKDVITGLLPRHSNVMRQPNTGVRDAIFDLNHTLNPDPDENPSRPFVYETEENTYLPSTAFYTIRSYDEYRKFVASFISFVTPDDNSTSYGALEPNFTWLGSKEQEEELAIKRQFEDNFEATFVTLDCLTHIVNISPFVMPTLTPAFVSALDALDEAAKKPNSASSRTTLKSFFRTYGTHFARTTHLGSQLLFGKLFPSRAANVSEDAARTQCVLESVVETLLLAAQNANDSTTLRFSRIAADKCRVEEIQPLVRVIGPLPGRSFDGWALEAIKNPRPIRYFAEKISSLFNTKWFKNVLKNHSLGTKLLNGSALYDFFNRAEVKDGPDPEGQPRVEPKCICTSRDMCLEGSSGTQDNEEYPRSPAEYGGVVIIGGHNVTITSETLGIAELPSFPGSVSHNTVSIVGSTVFSCGGYQEEYKRTCFYLREEDPTWRSIALPWPLSSHSAVTVQDTTIWFLHYSRLYSYDTAKDDEQFRKYRLGFTSHDGSCAVTNQSHTFIIGAGRGWNDVWVNRDPSKPTEWEKVANLLDGRYYHACLWFGNDIFVTGGRRARGSTDSVEVLNVTDMTIRSTRPLVHERALHRMAVLHGKPAVLGGGVSNKPTISIEVYEVKNDAWQTPNCTMKEGRLEFGLAQYTGPDRP